MLTEIKSEWNQLLFAQQHNNNTNEKKFSNEKSVDLENGIFFFDR